MIKDKLSITPYKPGCYLMKNKDGNIIYVGKAKDLKKRLSSYFNGNLVGKTKRLVSEIVDFDYIVVDNETEALILELNLIKQYNPKYNILMRDDKSYPYIELTNEEIPRLLVVRTLNKKKKIFNRLYGPYPNVVAARNTVNLLNRIYPLRKCHNYLKKPCLYYHIEQCLGYCANKIDREKIMNIEKEIITFLKGDHSLITKKIKDEMYLESNKMNYEKAKELKDLLNYIDITLAKQQVEINDTKSRDVFGYYEDKDYLCIQIFFIRGGKIVEKHSNIIDIVDEVKEELTRYIANFYDKNFIVPKEILVPKIVDNKLLADYLKTTVLIPIKGVKKRLVEMVSNNAKISLEKEFELIKNDEKKTVLANQELQQVLNLEKLERIEVFDNSTLFGSYSVSGMVVFIDGKPSKKDYRKFKISIDKNDDYGAMKEVIYRRYFKVISEDLVKPDLIIVDGGVGQINVAKKVIKSFNLDILVIGLKKDDKHQTRVLLANDPLQEINIDKKSNLFHYLERIQDEVHRYTINYHKQIRSKGSLESVLDNISGIGKIRKKELLKKYKTINKLKEIEITELSKIVPMNTAIELKKFLEKYDLERNDVK